MPNSKNAKDIKALNLKVTFDDSSSIEIRGEALQAFLEQHSPEGAMPRSKEACKKLFGSVSRIPGYEASK